MGLRPSQMTRLKAWRIGYGVDSGPIEPKGGLWVVIALLGVLVGSFVATLVIR